VTGVATARSFAEMKFATSLAPCPSCGSMVAPKTDLHGADTLWTLNGACPACGAPRHFRFDTEGHPLKAEHDRLELGGPTPSRIITAAQFAAELARLDRLVVDDPRGLDVAAWDAQAQLIDRAVTVTRELCKFPGASPLHLDERERAEARAERYSADTPRIWMIRTGGKLSLGEELRGLFLQVSAARIPTLAELEAYLPIRAGSLGGVEAMRAFVQDGAPTVALQVRRGTREEVGAVVGRLHGDRAAPIVAGHQLAVHVEGEGEVVSRVTVRFAPAG
jgi:hypothetical protein